MPGEPLGEDFVRRSLELIGHNPNQVRYLNNRLQESAHKKLLGVQTKLKRVRDEIQEEIDLDSPPALTWWTKIWNILKKILILVFVIGILTIATFAFNDRAQHELWKTKHSTDVTTGASTAKGAI